MRPPTQGVPSSQTGVPKQEFYLFNPQRAQRQPFGQKELFSCNSHRPRTAPERSPTLKKYPCASGQARGSTRRWSSDCSPGSGAAAWPMTLEEPRRKLHQATVLFHYRTGPPQLAFCCADRRQSAPVQPHQEPTQKHSEMGVGIRGD